MKGTRLKRRKKNGQPPRTLFDCVFPQQRDRQAAREQSTSYARAVYARFRHPQMRRLTTSSPTRQTAKVSGGTEARLGCRMLPTFPSSRTSLIPNVARFDFTPPRSPTHTRTPATRARTRPCANAASQRARFPSIQGITNARQLATTGCQSGQGARHFRATARQFETTTDNFARPPALGFESSGLDVTVRTGGAGRCGITRGSENRTSPKGAPSRVNSPSTRYRGSSDSCRAKPSVSQARVRRERRGEVDGALW